MCRALVLEGLCGGRSPESYQAGQWPSPPLSLCLASSGAKRSGGVRRARQSQRQDAPCTIVVFVQPPPGAHPHCHTHTHMPTLPTPHPHSTHCLCVAERPSSLSSSWPLRLFQHLHLRKQRAIVTDLVPRRWHKLGLVRVTTTNHRTTGNPKPLFLSFWKNNPPSFAHLHTCTSPHIMLCAAIPTLLKVLC